MWRDVRVLRVAFQIAFVGAVFGLYWWLAGNLLRNLRRNNLSTSFDFLDRPAGFAIADSAFDSSDPVRDALAVGVKNTLLVSVAGILIATILGVVVGVGRLSQNWLVRRGAGFFVETLRNVPVLVVILFFYTAVVLKLPSVRDATEWLGVVVLSNSGLVVPSLADAGNARAFAFVLAAGAVAAAVVALWRTRRFDRYGEPHHRVLWAAGTLVAIGAAGFAALGGPVTWSLPARDGIAVTGGIRLNPEYAALLFGLSVYTASHIAEIVRGSIQAVPRGQGEAAFALGLTPFQRMRFVVLPQAFRILIPPLGNQYLNLTKNSSLAIAIGFPEITRITRIAIGQNAPAPQAIAVLMLVYLVLSLTISGITNLINRRLQVATR